jgi:holliday junction DNA helicase RuvA
VIGKLTGIVDSTGDDWAILDVGGVGYLVFCSGRSLGLLPAPGGAAMLWIETHVREDHIHLFGFAETAERDWFRLLNSVQGVGAKMALAILSVLPPAELVRAIAAQDKAALSRANGVGPKLAGRIASELKDKAGKMAFGPATTVNGGGPANGEVSEDAVSALVNLGYRRAEAFTAVAKASGDLGSDASVELLIKAGLKELAS